MSMIKCAECGAEVSSTAKFCPQCGRKNPGISNTASAVITLVTIGICIWLYFSVCRSPSPSPSISDSLGLSSAPALSYPNAQIAFHQINKVFPSQYEAGANEIQRSAVFNNCNGARKDFLDKVGFYANGWVGWIESIETDQGGDVAYIKIVAEASGFQMAYQTYNNRLSDAFDNTMLKKGSKVYNQVGRFKLGDKVRFKAKFLTSADRGVLEGSLTEQGCVDEPEFIMRFDDIVSY